MSCQKARTLNDQNEFTPGGSQAGVLGAASRGPVLPLSPSASRTLRQVRQAIGDPGARSSTLARGGLSTPVRQALQVLDDPDFQSASAGIRALDARALAPGAPRSWAARLRRRGVLEILGRRYPQAFSRLRKDSGRSNPTITTPFFFVNVVAGPAAGRALEDLFPLDPLDSTGR